MPSMSDRLNYMDIFLKWNTIQTFKKRRMRKPLWKVKILRCRTIYKISILTYA